MLNYFTPYLEGDKFTILQDGEKLCEELDLNFDEVYKRTNTSYKPIRFTVWEDTDQPERKTYVHKWFSANEYITITDNGNTIAKKR